MATNHPIAPTPVALAATVTRFETYLYSRRGLGEITVGNYLGALRRLAPVLGLRPTPQIIDKFIQAMHKSEASYSHIINTSTAIDRNRATERPTPCQALMV